MSYSKEGKPVSAMDIGGAGSLGALEMTDAPLYDFVTYPRAGFVDRLNFFDEPVGADGKTYADTNLYFPGHLPRRVQFEIQQLELILWASFADRRLLLERGFLELNIGCKNYVREPLARFNRPRPLSLALMLVSEQNFSVQLNWPVPPDLSADVRIGIALDGVLYRPTA